MSKDDAAVKDETVVADTTTTAPAPEETESTEVAEAEAALENDDLSFEDESETADEEETEGEKPTSEKEEEKPAEDTKPESQPQGKAEERKQQLKDEIKQLSDSTGVDPNTEIRDLVARRNALRDIEETRQREAQIANEQGLLQTVNPETGEYYTPAEAERIARQQSLDTAKQSAAEERYKLEVQQNQQTIQSEARKALQDFSMFRQFNADGSKNPDFIESLAVKADQRLAKSLIFDENGTLVGSHDSPYEIYQTIADSIQLAQAKGQAEAQRSTEQMLANVDAPSSSSQAKPSKPEDAMFEAFDEEADRW